MARIIKGLSVEELSDLTSQSSVVRAGNGGAEAACNGGTDTVDTSGIIRRLSAASRIKGREDRLEELKLAQVMLERLISHES